jgi:hypothetical protein
MVGERLLPGDQAPDAVVLDLTGSEVHLASLWPHAPLMLNFVRHFG